MPDPIEGRPFAEAALIDDDVPVPRPGPVGARDQPPSGPAASVPQLVDSRSSTVAAQVPGLNQGADGRVEGSVGRRDTSEGPRELRVEIRGKLDRAADRGPIESIELGPSPPGRQLVFRRSQNLLDLRAGVKRLFPGRCRDRDPDHGSHQDRPSLNRLLWGDRDLRVGRIHDRVGMGRHSQARAGEAEHPELSRSNHGLSIIPSSGHSAGSVRLTSLKRRRLPRPCP